MSQPKGKQRSPESDIPIYFRTQRDIEWRLPDPMTHARQLKVEVSALMEDHRKMWEGVNVDRNSDDSPDSDAGGTG
jgi:hypothetical protein